MKKKKTRRKEKPNKIMVVPPGQGITLEGWRCPVCRRGNSPFTPTCPCTSPISVPNWPSYPYDYWKTTPYYPIVVDPSYTPGPTYLKTY